MINVEEIINEGIARGESHREAIAEALPSRVPGLVRVDDAAFMRWVGTWMQQYPVQPIASPDNVIFSASPWLLALEYLDGGKEILDRIASIEAKQGAF